MKQKNTNRYYYYNSDYATRTPRPPKKRSHFKLVGFILLLLVATGVGAHLFLRPAEAQPKSVIKKPIPAINSTLLGQQINQLIAAQSSLSVGVSIVDITTGRTYNYGVVDAPYIAASTAKLITACLFLHHVEQGTATLGDTVNGQTARYEMQQMIVVSDDDAWQAFNDILTHQALQAYANSTIGMTSCNANDNEMTPTDLSLLLSKLYKGDLLNKPDTNLLLSFMHSATDDQYIVAGVPNGEKVYHKIGYLDDRLMDSAIIENGKRAFALVIFSKTNDGSDYDFSGIGQDLFQSITRDSVAAFN